MMVHVNVGWCVVKYEGAWSKKDDVGYLVGVCVRDQLPSVCVTRGHRSACPAAICSEAIDVHDRLPSVLPAVG